MGIKHNANEPIDKHFCYEVVVKYFSLPQIVFELMDYANFLDIYICLHTERLVLEIHPSDFQ